MATSDKCVTIAPYFKVSNDNMAAFKKLCEKFVTRTSDESGCLYYGFSFDGENVHCREGYRDADGLLKHLKNVGPMLEEALKISQLTRVEVHGPADQLVKLRGPLKDLKPQYYALEYGFRR